MEDKKIKVLLINSFFHVEGGADTAFFNTAELLEKKGHDVIYFCMDHPLNKTTRFSSYFVSNIDFQRPMSFWKSIKATLRLFWSFEANHKLGKLIEREKPNLAHIHNIFYELSPSIIRTIKKFNIPIVMSLHDYGLVCPLRLMFRKNSICEECKNGGFLAIIKNRCIRNSFSASLIVYLSFQFHNKMLKTFDLVDIFIAPSRFLKSIFEKMGFTKKIAYLQNFIEVEKYYPHFSHKNKNIAFVGRLQEIKGIEVLVEAVKGLEVNLKIIGRGPFEDALKQKVRKEHISNIEFLGYLSLDEMNRVMKDIMFTVVPSIWYEVLGFVIIESFAWGKPVIASRIGGISELVIDNENGLLFMPGDVEDLRKKINHLLNHPERVMEMGRKAREWVEQNSNSVTNYSKTLILYSELLVQKRT